MQWPGTPSSAAHGWLRGGRWRVRVSCTPRRASGRSGKGPDARPTGARRSRKRTAGCRAKSRRCTPFNEAEDEVDPRRCGVVMRGDPATAARGPCRRSGRRLGVPMNRMAPLPGLRRSWCGRPTFRRNRARPSRPAVVRYTARVAVRLSFLFVPVPFCMGCTSVTSGPLSCAAGGARLRVPGPAFLSKVEGGAGVGVGAFAMCPVFPPRSVWPRLASLEMYRLRVFWYENCLGL
jgi:hypothetical protein